MPEQNLRALLAICGVLLFFLPSLAAAHREAEALSVIEFNPRSGAIEVVHRLNLHDLDHVLSKRLGRAITVGDSGNSLEAVAAHIAEAFALARLDGTKVPLKLAGMEISGGDLLAYYEAPPPDGLKGLRVFDTLLMPDLPGQTNRVNVELPESVETLIFNGGTEGKTVRLRQESRNF